MHELGVAQGVFDIVRQYVPEDAAPAIRRVTIRVGEMSGVVADSLAFCFSAIVSGTPYGEATLVIDRVPPVGHCGMCGISFPMGSPACACPACGSAHVAIVAGRELQVVDVELDDLVEQP